MRRFRQLWGSAAGPVAENAELFLAPATAAAIPPAQLTRALTGMQQAECAVAAAKRNRAPLGDISNSFGEPKPKIVKKKQQQQQQQHAPRASTAAHRQSVSGEAAAMAVDSAPASPERPQPMAVSPVRPQPAEAPEDIDEGDEEDPAFCSEYVNEIFEHLRADEAAHRVDGSYMARQSHINEKMRAILCNWMMEVHVKFKLLSETMFLSAYIVDKYLSLREISRAQLQLLGITAMLIASKFEEIYAVEVRDLAYVSDNTYSNPDIIHMELEVLNTLQFRLNAPSALVFLRRFSKAGRADPQMHTLSKYLTELSIIDYHMLSYKPSQIAAAAAYLSRRIHGVTPFWNVTLEFYTTYREADIIQCAREMNDLVRRKDPTLQATKKKYSTPRLLQVSRIPPAPDF
eukprot:TRINITY_DN5721_c0_g1_i2.p1 TRINITY_DN5721_c0_g1~~TRINITY_DN5721_c0_g1_i2.p1  ORF type:complete len:402 (-),score=136.97 TRINITY_DN5721_c0_g1_i2:226-1431(-)